MIIALLACQLWVADTTFGPHARGELVIDGSSARVSGLTAPVRRSRDSIVAAFSDSQGEFRGTLGQDGSIAGFWVQPRGSISNVEYATPVTLRRLAPNQWRGRIEPLDERFTLY